MSKVSGVLRSAVLVWAVAVVAGVPEVSAALPGEPCAIEVVEAGTGWPVPMVELRTLHNVRFVSDNAGMIAFDLPELMGRETWFGVHGPGYGVAADGFGMRGVRLTPEPGKSLRVEVKRTGIAKRLGRLTGAGLFAESQKLGREMDWSESGEVVCVEGDGTGIRYRRKHMRGVKGRNGRAKTREAKVGAIFIGGVDSGNEPFRKSDSTTYTATTEKWESYGRQLRREFDRRFREKPSKTLFLTDGGKWLRSVHRNFFPFAEPLLDFYHAAEHLKALLCAMGMTENTKAFKRKFKYHRDRMRDGKIDGIINWARKEGSGSEAVEKELNYFRENKSRMKYDEYIAKGWYIGSGVIEAGCKTVVCQRFKQPGMFWSPKSTKPLLPLRALLKSNRLCEYSNFLVKGLPQVDIQSKPA